jgi:signal transduction histidine kinase
MALSKPKKPVVLYLDDEKNNLTVFSSTFFDDYKVLTALTPAEAREHLQKNTVHVIVTDQKMPEMTGVEFLSSIISEFPDPIRMVLTGNRNDIETVIDAINKGRVYGYVQKPLMDDNELKVAIDSAIDYYFLQQENKHLLAELQEANRTLEAKVQERTEELQQANQQLEVQNRQLVELNKEKNEFLGIAAHDLKNPLSNIKMLSKVLFDEHETLSPEEVKEFASHVLKASEQMFTLITNLLDVNAIEQGGVKVQISAFDVVPVVKSVVDNYKTRAEAKTITLNLEAPNAPAMILADQLATAQVLDNLVSNAVKYSPHGKQVFVRVVRGSAATPSWRCEVQDQGPGLSDADKAKLFGKFARLSARPTGDEHSTGLGLSIVKKMAESMNAKVWCESELGKGATFIVEFPSAA